MPIIPIPEVTEDLRSTIYLIDTTTMPGLPAINQNIEPAVLEIPVIEEAVVKPKRAYKKKEKAVVEAEPRCLRSRGATVDKVVKRLANSVVKPVVNSPEKKKRAGRPRKNTPALGY